MKMTVFATNNLKDVESFRGREAGGHRAVFVIDPEEELVMEIDEQRMSSEKIVATRFLRFLRDNRLDTEKLKILSLEEQIRLRREFLGD